MLKLRKGITQPIIPKDFIVPKQELRSNGHKPALPVLPGAPRRIAGSHGTRRSIILCRKGGGGSIPILALKLILLSRGRKCTGMRMNLPCRMRSPNPRILTAQGLGHPRYSIHPGLMHSCGSDRFYVYLVNS